MLHSYKLVSRLACLCYGLILLGSLVLCIQMTALFHTADAEGIEGAVRQLARALLAIIGGISGIFQFLFEVIGRVAGVIHLLAEPVHSIFVIR